MIQLARTTTCEEASTMAAHRYRTRLLAPMTWAALPLLTVLLTGCGASLAYTVDDSAVESLPEAKKKPLETSANEVTEAEKKSKAASIAAEQAVAAAEKARAAASL
jgi:hypothetical protein